MTTKTSLADDRKRIILVVDDESSVRELLRQELEPEGYLVREARNGKEALEQVAAKRPDMMILDLLMPEMNGLEVVAELKSDPPTMDIPIIILSIVEEKEIGQHFGVDRYLTKPIDMEKLLREVSTLLSQGMSQKNVLVVAEDPVEARMLADLLRRKGDSVFEANTGQECIARASAEHPKMIIVDATFSEQPDLIKTLRAEKTLENVFLLLLESGKQRRGEQI